MFFKKQLNIISEKQNLKEKEIKKVYHKLSTHCEKCIEIFNRYPDFYNDLYIWFFKLQQNHPDLHISCAGRGKKEQQYYYEKHLSLAQWGQSAHNWNCAIDVFQLDGKFAVYNKDWFDKVIRANLVNGLRWYGVPNSKFYELPHIEVLDWPDLILYKKIRLVE